MIIIFKICMCVCAHTANTIVVWVFFVRLTFACLSDVGVRMVSCALIEGTSAPIEKSLEFNVVCMHLLTEFNKLSILWECSGVRCVSACDWIWKHKITLHITGSGVRHMETATLSHETSQFFGPSPRKQRLTVYRGS